MTTTKSKQPVYRTGSKAYLSNLYNKYYGYPCIVLTVGAGMEGKQICVNVLIGNNQRERILVLPSDIIPETRKGVLALWKELETANTHIDKVIEILDPNFNKKGLR